MKKRAGALSRGGVVVCGLEVNVVCRIAGASSGRGGTAQEGVVVWIGVGRTGRDISKGEPDDKEYHDEQGSPCTAVPCAARGHPLFS